MSLRLLQKEASGGDEPRRGGKGARPNQRERAANARNAWGRAPASPKAKAAAPSAWSRGPPGSSGGQQSAWSHGPPAQQQEAQPSAWSRGPPAQQQEAQPSAWSRGSPVSSGTLGNTASWPPQPQCDSPPLLNSAWGPPLPKPGAPPPQSTARGPPQQRSSSHDTTSWGTQQQNAPAVLDDLWTAPTATVDPGGWMTAPRASGDVSASAWGVQPVTVMNGGGGQFVGWSTSGKEQPNARQSAASAQLRQQLDLELSSCAVTVKQYRDKIANAQAIMQQLASHPGENLSVEESKIHDLCRIADALAAEAAQAANDALKTGDCSAVELDNLDGDLRDTVAKVQVKWREEAQDREEALQALEEADDLRTLTEAIEWCEELGLDIDASSKLQAFKRKDAAQKKLQEVAVSSKATSEDIAALEMALEEAKCCGIGAADAQCLLENLKVEVHHKAGLLAKLAAASTPQQIKDALHTCKMQGHGADPAVMQAEEKLREQEAVEKRLEMARLELRLASAEMDVQRLEQAIAAASELKLDVSDAQDSLKEAKIVATKRAEAQELINEAKKTKDETLLRQALALYSDKATEQLLAQWTKERKARETVAAHELYKAALEEAIRNKLVTEPLIDAVRDIPDAQALVTQAEGMLAECAPRVEILDAQEVVKRTDVEIEILKKREAELPGAANKNERRIVGKKIFTLQNDDNYLSAVRFLKNPEKEGSARRKKREADRAAEKATVEAYRQAKQEKNRASIEALLSKLPLRERDDAEGFLAELEQRTKEAEQDANLVEFVFDCDTRTFCQLLIEINTSMSAINCAEGQEFKLRSTASQKTLVIVFQTVELLRKIDVANRFDLSRTPAIHFSPHFTESTEMQLPQLRKDGEFLREKEVRNITIPNVADAKKQKADATAAAAAAARQQETQPVYKSGKGDKGDAAVKGKKGGAYGGKSYYGEQKALVAVPFEEQELKDLAGFKRDLQQYQQHKRVACEWRPKDRLIEVKGINIDAAKDELQELLNFYRDSLKRKSRKCYLWLDYNGGAGVDLTAYIGRGMYVVTVDEEPGQDFATGEIISQIADGDLTCLTTTKAIEEAFGGEFAENVELTVEPW
eukprot:GEMP01005029.1.p1 GENE.GEMP01005029.1~~GEMP01005029.1.p1  ORF type:complete len:1098 (+),score=378.09 GEMP01005029.1:228-3521(+)